MIKELTRRRALLDFILTNKEGLVRDVKVGGSLASDIEMVEFRMWRGWSREKSKIPTLDFRRGDFGLFETLLGRIPWETVLESSGVQVNIQGSPPPSLRGVHPNKKKIKQRQQEAYLVDQGIAHITQI